MSRRANIIFCSDLIPKCFSDGPSAAAPAVWSRLLHDKHGLKPELPHHRPPHLPGASPPPRPPASPSPPTTTTAPSLALAPAAARGQYPVDTPHQKLRSIEFLNENSPPCCPSALPPPLQGKAQKWRLARILNKKQLSLNFLPKLWSDQVFKWALMIGAENWKLAAFQLNLW